MMETKEELWNLLEKFHDIVKEHPFWITFEKDEYLDFRSKMRELVDIYCAWSRDGKKTTPQEPILNYLVHDTLRDLYTYEIFMREGVIRSQGFLMLVHSLLDEKTEVSFGYPGNKWKYISEFNGEEWKLKFLYPTKEDVIRILNRCIERKPIYKDYFEKELSILGTPESSYRWKEKGD